MTTSAEFDKKLLGQRIDLHGDDAIQIGLDIDEYGDAWIYQYDCGDGELLCNVDMADEFIAAMRLVAARAKRILCKEEDENQATEDTLP